MSSARTFVEDSDSEDADLLSPAKTDEVDQSNADATGVATEASGGTTTASSTGVSYSDS